VVKKITAKEDVRKKETLIERLGKPTESPYKKYQDLFVGRTSFFDFITYEFLTSFLSSFPGAAGFFLRKIFYKRLFVHMGSGSIIGPYLTLRCPNNIHLGSNVFIDSNVVLDAKGSHSKINIGDDVLIAKDSILSCSSAAIFIANEVSIGPGSYIRASRGPVTLGSCITIGAHTVIISGNPDYKRLDIPMMKQEGDAKGISVGDDVWVGVGVKIIDGVKIGNGCVIGAGAVVTKDISDYSIAAGVPAKVLRSRTS
jgi:acetyltransferase-like isoleucine patch superfamily enzyme